MVRTLVSGSYYPGYYIIQLLLCTEYVGNIPAEKRETTIQQLNKEAQRLIEVRDETLHIIGIVQL